MYSYIYLSACKYIFPLATLTKTHFSSLSNCIFEDTAETKRNDNDNGNNDDAAAAADDDVVSPDGILQLVFLPAVRLLMSSLRSSVI